ncbi:MAG TPA: hypothetical protein VKB31_08395 [Trueperaceae bacterium]|nr:hypothetical protein [Trueperaceae bacterium]
MRAEVVEQVFVRRRGGRVELLVVLETPAGERQRETLLAPTSSPEEAVRYAAVQLARRGLGAATRLRLRRDLGGTLVDDPQLKQAFLRAMAAAAEDGAPWD